MLYPERVLNAAKALPDGCFGHIYRQPANAYRIAALIFPIKFNQNTCLPSRSTIRYHYPRTLSNNRRTLSPKQREKCARKTLRLTLHTSKSNQAQPLSLLPFYAKIKLSQ